MNAPMHRDSTSIAYAVFAEKVEVEPSGRLTISGVVHGVEIEPDQAAREVAEPVQFGLCLGFLVGDDHPDYRLRIDVQDPDGGTVTHLDGGEVRTRRESGGGLLQILQRIEFAPHTPGLYWFQVFLDGEIRARIPLRVSQKVRAPESGVRAESSSGSLAT